MICQGPKVTRGQSARKVRRRSWLHLTQTDASTVSYPTGLGHGHGRTVDSRFDRSGDHCPIQPRVSISLDGGGRVVQVRVGGTRQIQDGERRDGRLRENFETQRRTSTSEIANGRRQRILQDVSSLDDTKGYKSFFHQRRHQGQRGGTIQSYVEETIVPLFHCQEYVKVFACVERVGLRVQSIVPS